MTKRLLTIIAAFALFLAACGDDDTTPTTAVTGDGDCSVDQLNLVNEGQLTIATGEPAFPPWVIDDDPTNKQGFEAAVAYSVAGELGFADEDVIWVRVGFEEAIAAGDKPFDFNIQQYSITAERSEVVDFSTPYYVTQQALVAFADSPIAGATSLADLKAYRLGAQVGTTSLDYIDEVIEPDEEAAVYNSNSDAKSALEAGQVDAIVFDLPTAFFITAVEIPEAAIVGALPVSEAQADEFGLLLAKDNPLTDCVSQAVDALRAAGTLDALVDQWLEAETGIPELAP